MKSIQLFQMQVKMVQFDDNYSKIHSQQTISIKQILNIMFFDCRYSHCFYIS